MWSPLTRRSHQIIHTARRLRSTTLEEIRVRGLQAAHSRLERAGFLLGGRELSARALQRRLRPDIRSTGDLIERLRNAPRSCHFFSAFDDREGTLATIRMRYPQQEEAILRKAQRIEAGTFDLLGYRDLTFGDPIDWHHDPANAKTSPLIHWSRIPYLDPGRVGDHKIIWELNRHQYFATLGQAYWFTGKERYAKTWVAHLTSWMDANPPNMGINWVSSLEVAFRAISWLWALQYFRLSPALTPDILRRMVGVLYQHGLHIERYLSTFFSPNTHLTGEALGLFYLGLMLPELRRADHWRSAGQAILEREIMRQVFPDGVYFEQASYYQRYTADFYLHFLILAAANQLPVQHTTQRRLCALLDHLMFIQRPDGTSPLIGDDDGGRLVTLAQTEPNDFRGTLATAGIALERPDYCYVAGTPSSEVIWLLGKDGMERFSALPKSPPDQTSRAFPEGGYFVMRDGWKEDADYMMIDCGSHGPGTGGHAHADILSFDLAIRGRPTLIDPGTYCYTSEPLWREYFRSSAAHNTVTLGATSSSAPAGPFRWGQVARPALRTWMTHQQFDFFQGSHDGFQRFDPRGRHERSVLFIKGMGWIIRDRVESTGSQDIRVHFHLAPGLHVVKARDAAWLTDGSGPGLELAVFATEGSLVQSTAWVAPVYGRRVEAAALTFLVPHRPSIDIVTVLISCRHESERCRVEQEVECIGGRAFRITGPRSHHEIAIGDGDQISTPSIETDAVWAAVRREPEGSPAECLMLEGTTMTIDGQKVFANPNPESGLGRFDRGAWHIESVPSAEVA